ILFTAGGTDAVKLAFEGLSWANKRNDVIVATGRAHPAMMETLDRLEAHGAGTVAQVVVASGGSVDVDAWQDALQQYRGRIAVATLMWANNEIGTIQPIVQIAQLCQDEGVDFHVDAVQAFGAVPITFGQGITTMAISGHKIGAPVG